MASNDRRVPLTGTESPSGVGESSDWWVYRGAGESADAVEGAAPLDRLPPPPPWRDFKGGPVVPGPVPRDDEEMRRRLGSVDVPASPTSVEEVDMVNAALFLRRPLIVTGPPGIGKSSLAHRVSRELGLGRVLRWTITSRSTLREGLYEYDAIGRIQDASARAAYGQERPEAGSAESGKSPASTGADIGDFVQLGPLGTALVPREVPRVLLVDEFDKSDNDLANDLLGCFEDGEFRIPELARMRARFPDIEVHTDDPDDTVVVHHGRVGCRAFPLVFITSNGERELPPAFQRRCLSLRMTQPDEQRLAAMLAAQFSSGDGPERTAMIRSFLGRALMGGTLAADQLLASEYLRLAPSGPDTASWNRLVHSLWRRLDQGPA